jgi:hypothetical protein
MAAKDTSGIIPYTTIDNNSAVFSGDLNVQNNLLLNIGNAGTDFTSAGGLDLEARGTLVNK